MEMHCFERAELGEAPFRFAGLEEKVYVAYPGAPAQPAGTCDYCGTGIRYCFHIRSNDGKNFVVGSDCVGHLQDENNRLMDRCKRELAKLKRKKREEERLQAWQKRQQEMELELQRQRDKNGGLTDQEIEYKNRLLLEKKQRQVLKEKNDWLIIILQGQSGNFCADMAEQLTRSEINQLSERQIQILRDIYAKHHGRRGSKKYDAAYDEFETKANI